MVKLNDLLAVLKEVQTDCDICRIAVINSKNDDDSVVYWKKRYNKMVSIANGLRKIISYEDTRFNKPYSTRVFDLGVIREEGVFVNVE
jgi:flavoprotein